MRRLRHWAHIISIGVSLIISTSCRHLLPMPEPARHIATIPTNRTAPDAIVNRYALLRERVEKQGPAAETLLIGDSITEQWERPGKGVWPKLAPYKPLNLGVGGDRTEHVLYRLGTYDIDQVNPRAVVIMIGTNNIARDTPQMIADGITAVAQRARRAWPDSNIIVFKVFPRHESPTDGRRKKVAEVNGILDRQLYGRDLRVVDIGNQFLQPDGTISKEIMPDFVHLSSKGYEIWAKAMQKELDPLFAGK